MHSFRVHADGTVTWTLRHEAVPSMPRPKPPGAGGHDAATTRRSERSAARLKDFQTAQRFKLARTFCRWKRLKQLPTSMLLPTSQPSLAPPPPSTEPVATQDQVMQQPTQQQEQMDADGRSKRAPSTPTSSDSPATPRAKRVLLPSGPPPPSLPPSPPSPQGGKQPPEPSSSKQTGDSPRRAGGSQGTDGEAGGSRRIDFSPSKGQRACHSCGNTSGICKVSGHYVCRSCVTGEELWKLHYEGSDSSDSND